jgi:hypothetical protein
MKCTSDSGQCPTSFRCNCYKLKKINPYLVEVVLLLVFKEGNPKENRKMCPVFGQTHFINASFAMSSLTSLALVFTGCTSTIETNFPTQTTNMGNQRPLYTTEIGYNMAVFRVVAPSSLVEVYRRFRSACCLHHRKHLWNDDKLLPDYTAQQPTRQPPSYLPPWKSEISPEVGYTAKETLHRLMFLWLENPLWTTKNGCAVRETIVHTKTGYAVRRTAAYVKMTLFWVVAPCSLVEVYQRFRCPCYLHHQGDESWWWRQQRPLKRW